MINAGNFNRKIEIFKSETSKDAQGFPTIVKTHVLTAYASVKTTRGMTLIRSGTDFEKAYTNFTIRYPAVTVINRDMLIDYGGKEYTIEYLNNVDEAGLFLEIQAKEVTH